MAKIYDHWVQFTPLLPGHQHLDRLREIARPILDCTVELTHAAHPSVREELHGLVRRMNSYYSNLIEGQGTHPQHIDRALRRDFSSEPEIANKQRIAVAHIEAEQALENRTDFALTSDFVIAAHAELYARLDARDRRIDDPADPGAHGMADLIQPGALRTREVKVGRHVAPLATAIPQFLEAFDKQYEHPDRPWDMQLIAIACAHHRMAWIHPFMDGNGRAIRLQTHMALQPLTCGLWSVNRGLARRRASYYESLAAADRPRGGDLDGRDNLSEKGLITWVEFFLETCHDQARFMTKLFRLDEMKARIDAFVHHRVAMEKAMGKGFDGMRLEAALPLKYMFGLGPMTRRDFIQATGLSDRTARTLLSYLLQEGLIKSDSPRGLLRLGLPLDALNLLLPELYPEAVARPE